MQQKMGLVGGRGVCVCVCQVRSPSVMHTHLDFLVNTSLIEHAHCQRLNPAEVSPALPC